MVKTSTKPKGATSYKETAFGIIPRVKLLTLELEGTKKGLDFIHHQVSREKTIKITPEFICKLHGVSFGWIFPKWAGKFRKILVTISGKEATPYFKIPELMVNLCEDLEERLKHLPDPKTDKYILAVVKLLAWFQHQFVFIHPFQDYNGRTARMLTILLLLKLNLPPVEIKAEKRLDRKLYITAMQKGDKGDLSLLENIIGQALFEGLERLSKE
ncbi:Fic family protein [Candidatus Microgenomates bacterium]|nr:Fic family protein [Candidatus Microgenomates bacterium]